MSDLAASRAGFEDEAGTFVKRKRSAITDRRRNRIADREASKSARLLFREGACAYDQK